MRGIFYGLILAIFAISGCERPQERLVTDTPSSSPEVDLKDQSAGCLEGPMAQFGQYLGSWSITDSQLSQNGAAWSDGPGAQWDFVCLGNGTAIQDYWKPNGGSVGTNLRAYHPENDTWEVAWVTKGLPGFSHIRAKQQSDGTIEMNYVSPIPNPLRKITFFPVQSDSWKWSLEFSSDGGDNWTEVYRINATRIH